MAWCGFFALLTSFALYPTGRTAGVIAKDSGTHRSETAQVRAGCFQPLADAIKSLFKEELIPTNADKNWCL